MSDRSMGHTFSGRDETWYRVLEAEDGTRELDLDACALGEVINNRKARD
jgi:hypothetical protein